MEGEMGKWVGRWSGSCAGQCSLRGKEGGEEIPLPPLSLVGRRGIVSCSFGLISSVRSAFLQLCPGKGLALEAGGLRLWVTNLG